MVELSLLRYDQLIWPWKAQDELYIATVRRLFPFKECNPTSFFQNQSTPILAYILHSRRFFAMANISHSSQHVWLHNGLPMYHSQIGTSQDDAILVSSDDESGYDNVSLPDEGFLSAGYISAVPSSVVGAGI